MPTRTKTKGDENPAQTLLTALALAPVDGDQPYLPPQLSRPDYRGIPFGRWLDLFLEYALSLVRAKKRKESYAICQAARDSIVFATTEDTFLIHVTWACT